jgi:hypothetical protein
MKDPPVLSKRQKRNMADGGQNQGTSEFFDILISKVSNNFENVWKISKIIESLQNQFFSKKIVKNTTNFKNVQKYKIILKFFEKSRELLKTSTNLRTD